MHEDTIEQLKKIVVKVYDTLVNQLTGARAEIEKLNKEVKEWQNDACTQNDMLSVELARNERWLWITGNYQTESECRQLFLKMQAASARIVSELLPFGKWEGGSMDLVASARGLRTEVGRLSVQAEVSALEIEELKNKADLEYKRCLEQPIESGANQAKMRVLEHLFPGLKDSKNV